jgi:hypothetical protein
MRLPADVHQLNHGDADHRCASFYEDLIIFAQSTKTAQPGKKSALQSNDEAEHSNLSHRPIFTISRTQDPNSCAQSTNFPV